MIDEESGLASGQVEHLSWEFTEPQSERAGGGLWRDDGQPGGAFFLQPFDEVRFQVAVRDGPPVSPGAVEQVR